MQEKGTVNAELSVQLRFVTRKIPGVWKEKQNPELMFYHMAD